MTEQLRPRMVAEEPATPAAELPLVASRWRVAIILAFLAGFTTLFFWIASTYVAHESRRVETAGFAYASSIATTLEQMILRVLEDAAGLHDLAGTRQLSAEAGDTATAAVIEARLAAAVRRSRLGVHQVTTIDRNGWLTWSTIPDGERAWLGDRELFAAHRDGRHDLYVSAPVPGPIQGRWSVHFTRPILDPQGGFAGVSVVSFDPQTLSDRFAELHAGPRDASLLFRIVDGALIAAGGQQDHAFVGQAVPAGSPVLRAARGERPGPMRLTEAPVNQDLLAVVRSPPGAPLAILFGLDAERELAPLLNLTRFVMAAALGASLLASALAILALMWADRRRARLAIRRAQARMRAEAEGFRRALLSSVSHDLRTPLTVIRGTAEAVRTLGESLPPERRAAMLGRVEDEAARMAHFLTSVLELVRAEEGLLRPRLQPLDFKRVVDAACARVEQTTGRTIRRITDPTGLPPVVLDPVLLERILANLLDNAQKFTPVSGRITAFLRRSSGGVALTVEDTGPGIPREDLARVFDPFFRAQRTDRVAAGSGLGLAICKGLAEAMGGRIKAESPVHDGRGTRVTVWFPAA